MTSDRFPQRTIIRVFGHGTVCSPCRVQQPQAYGLKVPPALVPQASQTRSVKHRFTNSRHVAVVVFELCAESCGGPDVKDDLAAGVALGEICELRERCKGAGMSDWRRSSAVQSCFRWLGGWVVGRAGGRLYDILSSPPPSPFSYEERKQRVNRLDHVAVPSMHGVPSMHAGEAAVGCPRATACDAQYASTEEECRASAGPGTPSTVEGTRLC